MSSTDDFSNTERLLSPSDEDEASGDRLNRLEAEMAALRVELNALRRASGVVARADSPAPRSAPLSAPRSAPDFVRSEPEQATSPSPQRFADGWKPMRPPGNEELLKRHFQSRLASEGAPALEELVGRYGMLALGALTVMVGAGIFMRWAITHGLLGPTVRVVLGALGAVVLALIGMRLRSRDLKDFGNIMLALALAVIHVVCWSAGPVLHVVPSAVALAIAFFTSLLLAEFALRKDEQALFCVGFGGASIAPFVTSESNGSLVALAAYGVTVISLAAAVLRDRGWPLARLLTGASFMVYLLSIVVSAFPMNVMGRSMSDGERHAAIGFAIAYIGAVSVLAHRRYRMHLLRIGAAGLGVANAAYAARGSEWVFVLIASTAAAAFALGLLHVLQPVTDHADVGDGDHPPSRSWTAGNSSRDRDMAFVDGAALPALLLYSINSHIPVQQDVLRGMLAVGWALVLIVLTIRSRGEQVSNAYPFAVSVAAMVAAAAFPLLPWGTTVALVAVALTLAVTHIRVPRAGFLAGAMLSLVIASGRALEAVYSRDSYGYTPFAELPSLTAAIVLAGWIALTRLLMNESTTLPWRNLQFASLVTWCAAVFGFVWVHGELRGAYSPPVRFALLVALYAVTGFAAVEWGRLRKERVVRVVGLALSAIAAGKALMATSSMNGVGTKVGVLLCVSAFLIGVAYRYRKFLGARTLESQPAEPLNAG